MDVSSKMDGIMVTDQKPALGVGGIISESFSILFGNIPKVMMLGLVPTLIGLVLSGLLVGWDVTLFGADPDFTQSGGLVFVVSTFAQLALYGVSIALLVQLAYDAKLGKTRALPDYFTPALKAALPIAILAIVSGILVGFAFVALVIPGLWLYAVFSMMAPAVVIDKAGYRALGRSAHLTKGYRWPVLGVILVVGICSGLLSFVAMFGFGIFVSLIGSGAFSIILTVVAMSAVYALVYGLSGVSIALIYARLREIKEGVSVDSLASVFD